MRVVVLLAVLVAGCGAADVENEARRRPVRPAEGEGEGESERDALWSTVSTFCERDVQCNDDGSPCIDNVSNTIAFVRAADGDVCEAARRSYVNWVGCVSKLPCDAAIDQACESESFLGELANCRIQGEAATDFEGWQCLAAYYNDGVCDCDCGIDDVDCASDEPICEYCLVDGQQINEWCGG